MKRLLLLALAFSSCAFAQRIQQPGGGGGAAAIACVGTPGNTTGSYRQQCQTASGNLYACNNAAGCTVAGDWTSVGTVGGGPFVNSALVVAAGTQALTTLALGTGNQLVGMNAAATAHEYKGVTADVTGNMVAGGCITSNSASCVTPPASAGAVGGFTGANIIAWLNPSTLGSPLFLQHPNALPAANSFMLFPVPTGSGNTTTSQYQWAGFSADFNLGTPSAIALATVNASPGTCGDATHVCQITTNGKGLTTAQSAVAISGAGGVTNPYTTTATLTSTPTTVTAATHSQGTAPFWSVIAGGNKEINNVTLASNGDLTFATASSQSVTVAVSGYVGAAPNCSVTWTSATQVVVKQDTCGFTGTGAISVETYDNASPANFIGNNGFTVNSTTGTITINFTNAQVGKAVIAQVGLADAAF